MDAVVRRVPVHLHLHRVRFDLQRRVLGVLGADQPVLGDAEQPHRPRAVPHHFTHRRPRPSAQVTLQ